MSRAGRSVPAGAFCGVGHSKIASRGHAVTAEFSVTQAFNGVSYGALLFLLAIGRALMTNPDLILMDEPTEGLAPLLVRQVGEVIGELKREGLSILLVEQNLALALSVADRVHVLNRGRIVHSSGPRELLANEDLESRYLGVS